MRGTLPLLDDREQRIAFWAAGFAAVMSALLLLPQLKVRDAAAFAGAGLLASAMMAFAARRRSRIAAAAAAMLLAFGPLVGFLLGSVAYMGLGGWLLFRGARQRYAEPAAGGGDEPVEAATRPARGRRRRQEPVDAGTPPARKAPAASKRYTPPQARR